MRWIRWRPSVPPGPAAVSSRPLVPGRDDLGFTYFISTRSPVTMKTVASAIVQA